MTDRQTDRKSQMERRGKSKRVEFSNLSSIGWRAAFLPSNRRQESMSAGKLALKPTDKDCQQRGETDSFWPVVMPGLITSNYREEQKSEGCDDLALECVDVVS